MKIGIMSMQRVTNYGSFLQAYGLMHTIQELAENATVEFVDYEIGDSLIAEENADVGGSNKSLFQRAIQMLSPNYRKYRDEQRHMGATFGKFCKAYREDFLKDLNITEERNILPQLDVLVIGSDEVFNCTQAGHVVGYSTQLFGKDNKAEKLISYAASFGSTTMEKLNQYQKQSEIAGLLREFDSISVRDNNSLTMVQELLGTKPHKHIDPVLLYDFPEVEHISLDLKNYIVVYAYADRLTKDEIAAIREFAQKSHKKILTLGFWQTFSDAYVLATPIEVLAYIKNADYVITDTFHGTVFSIKYQVPFATIIRESNKQKLGDLLDTFGLRSREVTDLSKMEEILSIPIDEETVQARITNEQNQAKKYLKNTFLDEVEQ